MSSSAGLASAGKFMEQDASVFSNTMDLNYMGTVNALKAALPGMVQRGEGHIVLVASVMAVIGVYHTSSSSRNTCGIQCCMVIRNPRKLLTPHAVVMQASQAMHPTRHQSGRCAA